MHSTQKRNKTTEAWKKVVQLTTPESIDSELKAYVLISRSLFLNNTASVLKFNLRWILQNS